MSIAEEIDYIFSKIAYDELDDIILSSDSRLGSYKMLKEDIPLCNNLASENIEMNLKIFFDCWSDSEIRKEITIKQIIDKCENQKTFVLTNVIKDEELTMKKFATFKTDNYMWYSVLIIEEAWGYSYFEIIYC
ncbi:hypothetical protein [uncultured Clostridium sp.]|jgi:hypothetical protein|uniref:hypothetical protein n=1 Tax=uncultured Clostridium sp. TaxID=59620 RepID=UPI00260EB0E3|nr:hypothetical protein [uncultured Clostridium sp.]